MEELNKISKKPASEQCAQENDIKSVSIEMLNDDCLIHIFQFLITLADRLLIQEVCKRWRLLIDNSWSMIKTLDFSLDKPINEYIEFSNAEKTGEIRKRVLQRYPFAFTIMLRQILQNYGRFITRIILSDEINGFDAPIEDIRCMQEENINAISHLCPNLKDIEIDAKASFYFSITNSKYLTRFVTKLKLQIDTDEINDEIMQMFFKATRNLKYFEMDYCPFDLSECLLRLPVRSMHTIILKKCKFQDDYLLTALKRLRNLKHLTLLDCKKIPKNTLEVVGEHCKNMIVLELFCSGGIKYNRCCYFSFKLFTVHNLNRLVNLQVLKIRHGKKVTDKFLGDLVQSCQQLTSLDISNASDVTDSGLEVISAFVKLERLNISYLPTITGNGLKYLYGLKELYCSHCHKLTDQDISMFIKLSPQLQVLDISGSYITNVTIHAAIDACKNRSNKVKLKIFALVGWIEVREIQEIPSFLEIISNHSTNILSQSDYDYVNNHLENLEQEYGRGEDYCEQIFDKSDYSKSNESSEYSDN